MWTGLCLPPYADLVARISVIQVRLLRSKV